MCDLLHDLFHGLIDDYPNAKPEEIRTLYVCEVMNDPNLMRHAAHMSLDPLEGEIFAAIEADEKEAREARKAERKGKHKSATKH